MNKKSDTSLKVNVYWVLAGCVVALLLTVSTVTESWQRIHPDLQAQLSLIAYSLSVALSYFSWVVVTILMSQLIPYVPMFSSEIKLWWLVHAGISVVLGLILLFIDTLVLWFIFSQSYAFFSAYYEKLLRWLPYEILAYWAAFGILSSVLTAKKNRLNRENNYLSRLLIKDDDDKLVINVADIDQIKAYDNYVIICQNDKQHIINDTMKHLQTSLDPDNFIRVHRSSIINLNKIISLVNDENGQLLVNLHNGDKVTVSRRNRAKLNAQFKTKTTA